MSKPTAPTEEGSHLGFYVSEDLTRETLEVVANLRAEPTHRAHVKALAEIIMKLTDAGLEAYYLAPLERAKVGMIALGTAKMGIKTARQGISVVANKLIHSLKPEQLLQIVDSLDDLLLRQVKEKANDP